MLEFLLAILSKYLLSFLLPVLKMLISYIAPILASILEQTIPDLITSKWGWAHKKKHSYIKKLKKHGKKSN